MHPLANFARKYTLWLERNFVLVLIASLLSTIVGTYYSGLLYKNLRTDIQELLPETAPAVKDLNAAQGRVTGLEHLEIVIESNDVQAAKKFQIEIAERLEKLPPGIAGKVKNNIKSEREFFEQRKSLYVDLEDLNASLDYIRQKKKAGRKSLFDLELDDEETPAIEKFDFEKLENKLKNKLSDFENFKDNYFQSKDGKTRIVLVYLPKGQEGMRANEALSDAAKEIIEKMNPKSFASDMEVGLGGDVQNMVEEHHGLISDLITSFVIVTALVTLVLWLYFKSVGAVTALSLALFAGIAWTFGLSYFLVGYLNANTAFLGSIVVGNGINFGIILLARFIEERKRSTPRAEALAISLAFTARATFTAALAAGFSYGSLILTQFRGFNQFGVIGAMGMLLCWLAAFTTMPALLIFLERIQRISYRMKSEAMPLMRSIAALVTKSYRAIAAITLLIALVSLIGIGKFSKETLESDLSKLRNLESLLHGSGFWGRKTDQAFGRNLTPTIILTSSKEDTDKLFQELKSVHDSLGTSSPFSSLVTLHDIVPTEQEKRLAVLKQIKTELTPEIRKKLSVRERDLVDQFLPQNLPTPFLANDLPPDVLQNFKETDGSLYTMIHVYPHLASDSQKDIITGTWNGEEVIRFTTIIRNAIEKAKVQAVIAGQPPVSADMLTAIIRDGPLATIVALVAVIVLVIVMFPHFGNAVSILIALGLGVLWMGGAIGLMGWKINFLNFITLPITFGIGVDYAVNILGRFHDEQRGTREVSIPHVIRNTGGAVLLCSSTTIIGYSSLLVSGSQAFVSFGRLAVLGEITCIIAALLSLPALWIWWQKKNA